MTTTPRPPDAFDRTVPADPTDPADPADPADPTDAAPAPPEHRDLGSAWWRLLPPRLRGRSLWIGVLDARTRSLAQGVVVEIGSLPPSPTPGDAAQLERFLAGHSATVVDGRHHVAALLSRPGPAQLGEADGAWAAVVYDSCAAVDVPCRVVHLAGDDTVVPVPRSLVVDHLDRLAS